MKYSKIHKIKSLSSRWTTLLFFATRLQELVQNVKHVYSELREARLIDKSEFKHEQVEFHGHIVT